MIEAIMAVALTAVILSIFSASVSTMVFLRRSNAAIQASNLVREELDALRSLPFAELLARTNGHFLNLPIQRGDWETQAVAGAPSGANALALDTAETAVISETGLLIPGNYRSDFDLTAKVLAQTDSPTGWGAGVAFRYRDAENHYRFRFASGGIALDRVLQGTATTLWSQSAVYSKDTWYTLRVVATGQSFELYRNGTLLTTHVDPTFTKGDLALISLSGAHIHADDVSVTEDAVTTAWDFDADAVDVIPSEWERFSYASLPSGDGTLTIAPHLAQTTISQATVTVTWEDSGHDKSMSGTTLISRWQ
jgi:hypothetical protein